MDEFWDADSSSILRTVDVYMTKLREKFSGTDAFEIQTVRGLGYKAVIRALRSACWGLPGLSWPGRCIRK